MNVGSIANFNYNNNAVGNRFQNENINKTEENELSQVQDSFKSVSNEDAGIYSSADAAKLTAEQKKSAFEMVSVNDYADGSDVKEMMYNLAQRGEREDVDISSYGVLKADSSDNVIKISKGEDGTLVVDVDGEKVNFSTSEAKRLIIDGGDGNDTILADKNLDIDLHIVGGAGNDHIETGKGNDFIIDNYGANYIAANDGNDRIIANQLDLNENTPFRNITVEQKHSALGRAVANLTGKEKTQNVSINGNYIDGGNGMDYIEGGMGNDYIIGGNGNDYIYGLDGNDIINGGAGRDYIDGGNGDDTLTAVGSNVIFGGSGNDTINAGGVRNVIVGGRGADTINTSKSALNKITIDMQDSISTGAGDSVETVVPMDIPSNIKVDDKDAGYAARAKSDLDSLASISVGQNMLNGLADTGHEITVSSTDGGNYCSYYTNGILKDDASPNEGSDSTVAYNRFRVKIGEENWAERAPIIGMYHEMAHSYDAGKGILDSRMYNYDGTLAKPGEYGEVKGAELQAVGIDTGSKDLKLNPEGISENALRKFLGQPNRPKY